MIHSTIFGCFYFNIVWKHELAALIEHVKHAAPICSSNKYTKAPLFPMLWLSSRLIPLDNQANTLHYTSCLGP